MENLNMSEMISIKNLCNFPVTFPRINSTGDVLIPANTQMRILRDEVISQVDSRNPLFMGNDGNGSHAKVYINDKSTREYVGFESEGKEQVIITDKKIKDVFAIKSKASFEKAIKELAQTGAEMEKLIEGVNKLGINEYDKIKIVEKYTNMKVD